MMMSSTSNRLTKDHHRVYKNHIGWCYRDDLRKDQVGNLKTLSASYQFI